jgi:hypothetical protein
MGRERTKPFLDFSFRAADFEVGALTGIASIDAF